MTPRRRQRLTLLLAALLPATLALGLWLGGHPDRLPEPVRSAFVDDEVETLDEALDFIEQGYYRRVDRDRLVDDSLDGAVRRLDDRFSSYLDPAEYARFRDSSHGEFSGIGVEVTEVPRGLRVTRVFPRTPAARAGLRRGDEIVAVGRRRIAGRPSSETTSLIRGRPGTEVTLTIRSRGRDRTLRVARARVDAPSVLASLRSVRGVKVGVITLSGFTSGAHGEVRAAVERLRSRGASAIALDLRGNGGGLLEEAVLVSSVFIPEGTIVSTDGRGRARQVYRATGSAIARRVPVAVLVDDGSASASEIVAGAFQDRRRGRVIGTRTFGKGVFQEVRELPNGGALDLTVGEYFTPKGRNLGGGGTRRGAGIRPDLPARDDPDTRADEALEVALRSLAAGRRR